jgi:hypothetical protein
VGLVIPVVALEPRIGAFGVTVFIHVSSSPISCVREPWDRPRLCRALVRAAWRLSVRPATSTIEDAGGGAQLTRCLKMPWRGGRP